MLDIKHLIEDDYNNFYTGSLNRSGVNCYEHITLSVLLHPLNIKSQ